MHLARGKRQARWVGARRTRTIARTAGAQAVWQSSTAVVRAKMATMLSRAVLLAESLGRFNGSKVRHVAEIFRCGRSLITRSARFVERAECPSTVLRRWRSARSGERKGEARRDRRRAMHSRSGGCERRGRSGAILNGRSLLNRAPGSRAIRSQAASRRGWFLFHENTPWRLRNRVGEPLARRSLGDRCVRSRGSLSLRLIAI